MGEWKSKRGRGSDIVADILGQALKNIGMLEWPSLLDVADAIEFVSRGTLIVEVHSDAPRLGNPESMSISDLDNVGLFKTIPNRGQIR